MHAIHPTFQRHCIVFPADQQPVPRHPATLRCSELYVGFVLGHRKEQVRPSEWEPPTNCSCKETPVYNKHLHNWNMLLLQAVRSTGMNSESSRSHLLIYCFLKRATEGAYITNKLCLADLAGSERQSKTKAEGVSLSEGCAINKSLSALGNGAAELGRPLAVILYTCCCSWHRHMAGAAV